MKKSQPPTDESPALHVDSVGEEHWTWRYVAPGVELHSNDTYTSREAAREWASKAYPDVPFADEED